MKKYLLAMAIAFISASSFAQDTEIKKLNFSVGAEGAVPIGDFKDIATFGFGGSALGEYMPSDKFGVTLNAGYLNFTGKKYGGVKLASTSQVPVLAGVRYYFIKDIYVSGQAGISFFNNDLGSAFTYAPGIGVKFSVLDATLKYMGATKDGSTISNVGLRVAYTF